MIRAKNSIVFLIFLLISSTALAENKGGDYEFTIDGSINLEANSLVVIGRIAKEQLEIRDSVYTDAKGRFSFVGNEPTSCIYYITFNGNNPPGVPLVVENGAKIKLQIENKVGYPYTVEGGKYNADMHKLHGIYTKYDALMQAWNSEKEAVDPTKVTKEQQEALNKRYNTILRERTSEIEEFVRSAEASPVSFFAVRFMFSRPEPKLIIIADEKMTASMPESDYTAIIHKIRESLGNAVEGAMAPDIMLKSPEGDTVQLSSLKGKVVLLDFWASWCGPCRAANPYVKEIYEKYHDLGFEIYAVALDYEKAKWTTAILQDGLQWIHVSDLRGWSSVAAKEYGVHSIPQTFLIDKEGRIHRTGLPKEELGAEIELLLNQN